MRSPVPRIARHCRVAAAAQPVPLPFERGRLARLMLAALFATLAAALVPAVAPAQAVADTVGPDTVRYTPERGAVTFTHRRHSQKAECVACHHESRPEKPSAPDRPKQKCSTCHTAEPVAPMKTSLRNAYHITAEKEGTCFTCHKREGANGKTVPTVCADCHRKADGGP